MRPAKWQAATTIIRRIDGKKATSILMGTPVDIKRGSPESRSASLALQILGGDTLTGLLGKRLRVQLGLTYGIRSRLGDHSFSWAPWLVTMSVASTKVPMAIEETMGILNRFYREGVSQVQLETQVSNANGSQIVSMANAMVLAQILGYLTAVGLNIEELDRSAELLQAITLDDVVAVIKKHFDPSKLVTVIAGSAE